MKSSNKTRNSIIFSTLFLMVGAIRFLIADGSCSLECQCSGAASVVVNGGQTVSMGGCAVPTSSSSGTVPVITSTCAVIDGNGGGIGKTVSFTVTNGQCVPTCTVVPGSLDINLGGTGCDQVTNINECGYTYFRFSCPKHSGKITLTATADDECLTNSVAPCGVVSVHYTAVTTIQVQLTPDQEKNASSCPVNNGPSSGNPGSTDCNGGCSGGTPSASTADVENDSLDFRLYLGRATSSLMDAGFLWLYTNAATANLASPNLLQAPFARPGVQVLTNSGGGIQQVVTPVMLVNVNPVSTYDYHLDCYYLTNVTNSGSYLYQTNGPLPFVTWDVQNPDGAAEYDRLWITEYRGGSSRQWQYTYTGSSNRWDLLEPDSQTTVSSWWVPVSGSSSNYFRQVTAGGQELSLVTKTYQFVSALNQNLLLQRIDGDGSTTRTNTYTYYSSDPTNGAACNQLERIDNADGSFSYFVYDSLGRVITNFSTFANYPAPPSGSVPNPLSYPCKVTIYAYTLDSTLDGVDDPGTTLPFVARKTILQVPVSGALQEISRSYRTVDEEGSYTIYQTQTCPNPPALWGNAANLCTYTENDPNNCPSTLIRNDGTASIFDYSSDYSVREEWRGQPNSASDPSSIVNGTYTVTTYDDIGNVTNVVTTDYVSGATLVSNTYNYKDSSGNTYDRRGRLSTVLRGPTTDTLAYNVASQLLGESWSGGPLSSLIVTNAFDNLLRRTNLSTYYDSALSSSSTYGYDAASRLQTVADGAGNTAAYSYLANSPLVGQIGFTNSGAWRMTTTKNWDNLNRLSSISSTPSASYTLPFSFSYTYNSANQRTLDTLNDGSYWLFGYDPLGQVTNGCKYFSDGTPVAGQQFDYLFDTIGNRLQTQAGGDQTGSNLRVANYTNNTLNQITGRDVPGYVDIMGASILSNSVTVNGQTAYRKQEYFRQQIPVSNTTTSVWTNIIVSGGLSVTGNIYVAKEPEIFKYDADGNLTNDGRWAYTWDAENRLIQMTANTSIGPQYQLAFTYDYQGRRIQKIVTTNNLTFTTNLFGYDGWNLVASGNLSLYNTYVWGLDLSGSLQGAGGVGVLLEVSYHGGSTTNCFAGYDGNGNVMALVSATNGTIAAEYDYGPFGEVIRATGPMAKLNPFRFSTKYQDDETDFLYYGYRFYNPSTGRWESRDPLGEPGFELLRGGRAVKLAGDANRYMFIKNDSIDNYDPLGLNPAAACAIGIALLPIEVPVGAIITGVAVVGGVAVITYAICKHFCNRPDICPLTGQMEQPPIGDPGSGLGDGGYQPGYKICIYTCPKKGVVRQYFPPGTTCQPSITQP